MSPSEPPLLSLEKVSLSFQARRNEYFALRNVSFQVHAGQIVSLVGESGCGKSLTARVILGLPPDGAQVEGRVLFQGEDLCSLSKERMQTVRGRKISMIFQEPMTALNPVLTVGFQVAEVLLEHEGVSREEAREKTVALFRSVGLPEAQLRYDCYPHELSGGMRQRILIAMALVCNPVLLLADEPTTALDATISQQILQLLVRESRVRQMSVLYISHDLSEVASIANRVCVMYAGTLVEDCDCAELFSNPLHPYTQGLLQSSPSRLAQGERRLPTIPGVVPRLTALPKGCPFAPRCHMARGACHEVLPPLRGSSHKVACFYA